MKPRIRVSFVQFWPGFTAQSFRKFFPYVYEKYDLVDSDKPEVVFYSVFTPQYSPENDPRTSALAAAPRPGKYLRVFFTGENAEPDMQHCDFAITFSARTANPNHLRLPLWVYENRGWGYGPERLVKELGTDWEKIAREKTAFCNFVYSREVGFRDSIFEAVSDYKRVDAAGRCRNNMNGWMPSKMPNRLRGKLDFFRGYKFTLAVENSIWPGYMTEKLVDPMYVNSIPIYVGDPEAKRSFDPRGYVDLTSFASTKEMMEFVRELDNNRAMYLEMLAAPYYRENRVPDYARDEVVLRFFDRIVEAALRRRRFGDGGMRSAVARFISGF